ncbi:unnamed protein product [Dicrocoelium dendriticum]|nr:unnamed protein product [Dicrocoelium dendriticum]
MLLWISVFFHDYFHGKCLRYSSRGSALHLCMSILYYYVTVILLWSTFHQVSGPLKWFSVTLRAVHVTLVTLHLLSKTPIMFNSEEPRRRRARLTRFAVPHQYSLSTTVAPHDDHSSSGFRRSDSANSLLSDLPTTVAEAGPTCFSKALFLWMNKIVSSGYYGELSDISNLPALPERLDIPGLESRLPANPFLPPAVEGSPALTSQGTLPFFRCSFTYFGKEFLLLGLAKLTFSIFNLLSPVFLNYFILSLSTDRFSFLSLLWGGMLILLSFISTIAATTYDYRMSTFGYKIRVATCGLVYRRILSTKFALLNSLGTGSILNYLTSDVDRIVNFAPSVHEAWAMPLQVVLALILLYRQLGVSCFVGVGFLIVLLPFNRFLAYQIGKYSKRLMHFKDARIKLMSEVLPNMATVKLTCWEKLVHSRISTPRSQELRALWGQKLLDAICVFSWAVCPALLAGSTFATYVTLGNNLSASVVFTSLALFGMLIGPMNALPWVLNGVMEAVISIQRISSLLTLPSDEYPPDNPAKRLDSICFTNQSLFPTMLDPPPVDLHNARFFWSDPEKPVLSDVSLCVQKGQLVGVLGPVGSGKSALLLAVLGELQVVRQEINDSASLSTLQHNSRELKFAYVGQPPWLCSGTIRENITFGSPYDADWMSRVVFACALEPDLRSFSNGLDSDVGEAGGSRLSGGQRARVALARAVYQKADVYLFDDPLSAVDVHVAEHIIQHCFVGLLSGTTRIITSHQAAWLIDGSGHSLPADIILELEDGRIVNRYSPLYNPSEQSSQEIEAAPTSSVVIDRVSQAVPEEDSLRLPTPAESLPVCIVEGEGEAVDRERMAFGSISSHTYWSYVRAMGYFLALSTVLSLILMQGSRNAADWWLARWVQLTSPSRSLKMSFSNITMVQLDPLVLSSVVHSLVAPCFSPWANLTPAESTTSNSFYLYVYSGIIGGHVVAATFRSILFALSGLAAAATVHRRALETITRARLSYFDYTPQGRILNRFSSDVGTVDFSLPFVLNILLANVAALIGVIIISCIALPFLIFLLLPLTFVFWSVQNLYRGAARDLKRISSVSRSPVYSLFSDTLSGLTVIRGLRQESRFRQLFTTYIGNQVRADLASLAAGSWLGVRLQLLATGVVAGVVCLGLVGRVLKWTEIATAALSASYALSIANLMTGTVYITTETEKDLIALERCQEIADDTPIESETVAITVTAPRPPNRRRESRLSHSSRDTGHPAGALPHWPSHGRIEFHDVSLSYKRFTQSGTIGTVEALRGVTFTIESGQRLGIVGRTGSGKSSLLKVLFRLVDHFPGPVTNRQMADRFGFIGASGQVFVGDVDIRTVPLPVLRSRMLAIGQESFLFSGCLRTNLDPDGILDDVTLIDVLLKCRLASTSSEAADWLSRDVGEAGRNLSAGQRQLVCIARALLRSPRPNIVCVDEATAAMDPNSEKAIHDILDREFQGATLMLIAHRLSSIRRLCDQVIVMHNGQIVAQGYPDQLLSNDRIVLNVEEDAPVSQLNLIDL